MKRFFCFFTFLATLIATGTVRGGQLAAFATLPPGSTPQGGLALGRNGDFYGVIALGAPGGASAIFDLTQSGYLFPPLPIPAAVGANASGPLVGDGAGNLYGVAAGSISDHGTLFEFSRVGALTRFATFNGTNGSHPVAPLLLAGGQFYGASSAGGTNGAGAVFRVGPSGVVNLLASLGGPNGSNPEAGVVFAGNGVFLGTTPLGGEAGSGVIFSLIASNGVSQPLFSFSPTNGGPPGALTAGPGGNLYGVTAGDGTSGGTIFQISTRGRFSTFQTLHIFSGMDGAVPNSPLLLARDGRLYGTTQTQGLNGLGTIFSVTTEGDFTLLGSFTGTDGASPRGGLLQGPDGNFYGVALGAGAGPAVFQLGGLAPEIVQAPTNRIWAPNGRAAFTVVAAGSAPLSYQWLFNDAKLADETNSTLILTGETTNDIGAYSVVVSNPYGSTNVSASLATPAPTISLQSLPAVVTADTLTLQGRAAAKLGVAAVELILNGNPVPTTNDFPQWSATLALSPGSNTIQVAAIDNFGAMSRVINASIFYKSPAQLTWIANGFGRIVSSASTNPAPAIGRWVAFTAAAQPQNIFSGWTISSDGVETNSLANPLRLLMPSNLVLQANFTTNFFRPLAGAYAGLFFDPGNPTPQTAGMIRLSVGPGGGFSGRLLVGGGSGAFSGIFNGVGAGEANVTLAGPGGLREPLTLQLTLTNGASALSGSVSGGGNQPFLASLTAERSSTARQTQRFTLLLPPSPGDDAAPPGYGFALVSTRNSVAAFSGRLADGTFFSESAPLSVLGHFPLYASLYGGAGLVLGWLDFSSGSPQGTVTWIKQPSAIQTVYRMGFTNVAAVLSSPWTNPPPSQPAFAPNPGLLSISGGGLSQPLHYTLALNAKNQLVPASGATNSLALSVTRATGVVRVTFGDGRGRATATGLGAILQNNNFAGGYFLGPTNAGAITLQ